MEVRSVSRLKIAPDQSEGQEVGMPAERPEDCDVLFGEYAAAGDLEALLSLYEEGATYVTRDGKPHTGLAEIREVLSGVVTRRPRIRMNVFFAFEAGGDLAVLYNDGKITTKTGDGREKVSVKRTIEVVRRQPDNTWRFVFDDANARDRDPEE
jgi:uncharacterized protein (TIGR02246 family)